MDTTITFIGGGHMAEALIGGLIAAGHPAARIRVSEPDAARRERLQQQHAVRAEAEAAGLLADCNLLVLAVKPQVMREACRTLKPSAGTTVLSIAAGLRLDSLRRWLGTDLHYVRAMPNTPALLRAGIAGLYAPPATPPPARAAAAAVLEAVGEIVWVEREAQLDAVTAVSGSGPAYAFLLVEAMREAGAALGLPAETAATLAAQTLRGAAAMLETADAAALRAQVTSKGGTTAAALAVLEDGDFRGLMQKALTAAERRGRELGDALADS